MKDFNLRDKKKALLKYSIMEEMLRLLNIKELNEISVEEICKNVNTSKVTFFKYFSYKEQVLDYYVYKWQYDRSYEIQCKGYKGVQDLQKLFQSISNMHQGQKFMVSLVQYYSKLTEKPSEIEISYYEYYLFNQQAFSNEVNPLNLKDIFLYYISTIENIPTTDYPKVLNQLVALMYGVPIQNHIMGQNEIRSSYEFGVNCIVG